MPITESHDVYVTLHYKALFCFFCKIQYSFFLVNKDTLLKFVLHFLDFTVTDKRLHRQIS